MKGEILLSESEKMMNNWLRHRNITEQLVDIPMKDEDLTFKPWEGAMTLGELFLHIVYWNDTFVSLVKNKEFMPPNIPVCTNVDELRSIVKKVTRITKEKYRLITDLDISSSLQMGNFAGSGSTFLTIMYDHEIHHKGQLFVYLRLLGKEKLPFFRDYK